MRDILPELERWSEENRSIGVATVVQTWGSSPRREGAKLAFTANGGMAGSVSGGCVENAVIEEGLDVLRTGRPRLLHFGVADESAWEVGLACGGSLDVFVKVMNPSFFDAIKSVLADEIPAVAFTVIRGPEDTPGREFLIRADGKTAGRLGERLDELASHRFDELLARGESRRLMLDDSVEVFAEVIEPSPTLVILGGVHISIALASLAKTVGFRTVVIDPRRAWGSGERFPHVERLIQAWPEEAFGQFRITSSTAIAALTHDPKLDDPALKIALTSPAFYVGALGSGRTQSGRRARLLEEGLTESQLARLHGPIGLDLAAETPEEIALAILAEVVEAYRKRTGSGVRNEAMVHQLK